MSTAYSNFAREYSDKMGEQGDKNHKYIIDPAMYSLVGNLNKKVIYDIGCGNGYMARYFAKEGANEIWASDYTKELIEIAKEKTPKNLKIAYFQKDASDIKDIPQDHFDMLTMNMVIHYLSDMDKLAVSANNLLKKQGSIIFATYHPLKPITQNYRRHITPNKKSNSLEGIFDELKEYLIDEKLSIKSMWKSEEKLTVYKRPLSSYINSFLNNGFTLTGIIEPKTDFVDERKNLHIEIDMPVFVAIKMTKVA